MAVSNLLIYKGSNSGRLTSPASKMYIARARASQIGRLHLQLQNYVVMKRAGVIINWKTSSRAGIVDDNTYYVL